ncbi:MAG: exodeoxyribonuclease V subunit gamma [Desulfopila sp.]
MFYLHASNKTENLLRHLAALIEADPPEVLFDKEYILIQSQGMERMISQYMAEYFTSWCNYRFHLPLSFLQDIAEKLGMELAPDGAPDAYDRNVLCWRIEEKLRTVEDAVYRPLHQYLKGSRPELKRFQLARQIANVFDQYQLMRPGMIAQWQQNRCITEEPAERWQMELWNRLMADDVGGRPRGEVLQEIVNVLQTSHILPGLPKRISVFGVHILPPLFIDYLNGLANHCDVHLFLLSPCRNYWGDIDRKKIMQQEPAPEALPHPLLAALGGQGRNFQELLLDKVEFAEEITSYEDPRDSVQPTLLTALQSDLLGGTVSAHVDVAEDDRSIRVAACHTRQRELSVLKDHVVDLLESNYALELRDIVVMAPDIQEYAPFIPAIFEDVQHSIADKSLYRRNTCITLFKQFLDVVGGRCGWSEVLDLLKKEQVSQRFNLDPGDLETIQRWVVDSGIRWGLTGAAREQEGFLFVESSWEQGLERLLMGAAVDTEEEVAGVWPYTAIEGNETRSLGVLCAFIHILQCAQRDFCKEHDLQSWSGVLLHYAEQLFGEMEGRDMLDLSAMLHTLNECGSLHGGLVSFDVVSAWLKYSSTESRSASGFLKGSLTFCSMLPMRSIPFTAICLIGLDYGVFPDNDRQATYDLMKYHPLPGDRSLRADDRYQFLEILLAARQSLYISYCGQSIQTNDTLPPSVVVSELLEVLEEHYGVDDLTEFHPLHGFCRRYFTQDSTLFSYSRTNYEVARRLQEPGEDPRPWWRGTIDGDEQCIGLTDLLSFYSNPQRFFVQHCLGIGLGDEDVVPEESEPFVLEGLHSYAVDQILLDKVLRDNDPARLYSRLCHDGNWPLGTPGALAFREKSAQLYQFAERIKHKDMGRQQADVAIDIHVGSFRIVGTLGNLYENGLLLCRYAKLRAADLLRSWLFHHVACIHGRLAERTTLVMKDYEVCWKGSDMQKPDLEELLMCFREGRKAPSRLLLEPGLSYCRQLGKKRATVAPLDKARQDLRNTLENGYEPAWQLLYQNVALQDVINTTFAELTEQLLLPLWKECRNG